MDRAEVKEEEEEEEVEGRGRGGKERGKREERGGISS